PSLRSDLIRSRFLSLFFFFSFLFLFAQLVNACLHELEDSRIAAREWTLDAGTAGKRDHLSASAQQQPSRQHKSSRAGQQSRRVSDRAAQTSPLDVCLYIFNFIFILFFILFYLLFFLLCFDLIPSPSSLSSDFGSQYKLLS